MNPKYRTYAEYLESDHWEMLKQRKAKQEEPRCAACGTDERIDLHHMLYRDDIETAALDDTCWLCRRCHKIFHEKAAKIPKDTAYCKVRLAKREKKPVALPAVPSKVRSHGMQVMDQLKRPVGRPPRLFTCEKCGAKMGVRAVMAHKCLRADRDGGK